MFIRKQVSSNSTTLSIQSYLGQPLTIILLYIYFRLLLDHTHDLWVILPPVVSLFMSKYSSVDIQVAGRE